MFMKRTFDLILGLILLVILAVPMGITALLVKLTSKGPILYWSQRVGQNNQIFLMPKFRSMKVDTPQLATHLLKNPKSHFTPIGDFIRKTSLDELPQLISVFSGHMSFVGPRPALFNQLDLVELRTGADVHKLKPGITGWAQINGRDEISLNEKVKLDVYYAKNQSLYFDLKILFLTFFKVLFAKNVTH